MPKIHNQVIDIYMLKLNKCTIKIVTFSFLLKWLLIVAKVVQIDIFTIVFYQVIM